MTNTIPYTCCFTGHRPEKLDRPEHEIIPFLRREIAKAIEDGFYIFISGMSRGVDIWAAEEILRLRDCGADLKLVCAVPFVGFENSWSADWQERYRHILSRSDLNCRICESYSKDSYLKRDRWMVDRSARVIAVYDGKKGGTGYTLEYARRNGIEIRKI